MSGGSELLAPGQRSTQRHLVGVLDVPADGHTESQPADLDVTGFEQASEIKGGGLAFDVGIGSEYDLFDVFQACHQSIDREFLRSDAALWRQSSQEDMVEPAVLPGALDRLNIERLLYDTDGGSIAKWIGADRAWVLRSDRIADAAGKELVLDVENRLREARGFIAPDFQQVMS